VKKLLKYLLIAAGVVAATAVILNFAMMLVVGGRQVTVPDIRGLGEAAAREALSDRGLNYEVRMDVYSIEYPESTVAEQDPLPGKVVKRDRKVWVAMSLGGEFQDVPYFLGKTLRASRIILERAGLEVGAVTQVSSKRTYTEEVMASEPVPGTPVVKGSRVNLLVSTGPPALRVLMPDLRGKSSISVKLSLERLGMFVKQSSLDDELNPLRSYVVLHEPPRGAVISRGDTVTLFVSSDLSAR
jgi:beta-lactam-binding protein with PASTA domain